MATWLSGGHKDDFCGLGHNYFRDGFMGRLTTTRMLWMLQGLFEDNKKWLRLLAARVTNMAFIDET